MDRYLPVILEAKNNHFMPRAKAETDPSFKQVIPYVVITDGKNILHYVRGKKAGEQRLVAKGSVGIGGHINDEDHTLFAFGLQAFRDAVQREVCEELSVAGSRPPVEMELAVATMPDGGYGGLTLTAHGDAGVAVGSNAGLLFRLMYPDAPCALEEYDVVTNGPPGKPFRGPNGPPAFFALEQAVDMAAARRKEDPIALRRRWDADPLRRKLYDAAATDGASPVQRFFQITLPLLNPTTFFVTVTNLVGAFQIFDTVYAMTDGGPSGSTEVLNFRIYETAFRQFDFGYASTLAALLFLLILAVTLAQVRFFAKRTTYDLS